MSKFIMILKYSLVLGILLNSVSAQYYTNNHQAQSQKQYDPPTSSYQPFIAENGSYKGQISDRTYRPKDTYVHSYQRQDGTRVRGHYRSKSR